MTDAVATRTQAEIIEQVVVSGDLVQLSPEQRVTYYRQVCDSLKLNPFTKPFDYIRLNGKLTLYAKRDATDQLRKLHGISVDKPDIDMTDDLVTVTVTGHDEGGRTDTELGAVSLQGLRGEPKANAIMKAVTKAKRRLTLSLVGLGWTDETEIETIPSAQIVAVDTETGEIAKPEAPKPANGKAKSEWQGAFWAWYAQALTAKGINQDPTACYDWMKEQGHMAAHLAEYSALHEAQKAAIDAMPALKASLGGE